MSYEEFWEMDCELARYYRRAAQIRQDLKNQDAWIQGAYIYEALVKVAPILRAFAKKGTKAEPYRTEPFDLYSKGSPREKEAVAEKRDTQAKAYMEAFAIATNKKFQKKKESEDNGR